MWLMTKTVLLLHEVLVVVSSMWKAHVKLKVSSKNEPS
jgi:hypothetical protein